jgi:hypothetical protein
MAEGSVEFFCGALGSGKTSCAFERALLHLLKGGTVVTNIRFIVSAIARWMHHEFGLKFDPARLVYIEDTEDFWKYAVIGSDALPTMLIIDEAHVEHNARTWDKTSFEVRLFNTMARKLNVQVGYITQEFTSVDKQFRSLAQRIWYCREASQIPVMGGLIKIPFKVFFRVPYVCGPGIPPRPMQPEIVIRPISFGMYETKHLVGRAAETFASLKAADVSPLEKIPKPPKPFPWELALPAAAALALAFL